MTRRYHPDRLDAAIEEYRKIKAEMQAFARANRARIDAEAAAMTSAPRTIEEHVASARREMGEELWRKRNEEWANA